MAAVVIAVVGAAATGGAAHADDEATALAHLQRGVEAFEAGEFQAALRELTAAHQLAPDKPNPYRWLALTQVQLGDCRGALVNIEGFLTRVPPDEPRAGELIRLRALCQQVGVLHVDATPARVSLRIDGADVGETPFHALSMRAGEHTLVAERAGYRRVTRAITLPAGGELTVHLHLAEASPPVTKRWWFWPAVAGGAIAVTAAIVWAARGDAPGELPPISCGDDGCAAGAR